MIGIHTDQCIPNKLIVMIMIDDRNDNALGMRRETRRMISLFIAVFRRL